MPSNLNNSDYIVGVQAAALATEADGGYIRIYDGIQPHTADNPVGFSFLLAELRFGSPAFGSPIAGTVTARAIASALAGADGAATWYRVLKADGATALWDGSIGTIDADMILNSTAISAGATVALSGFARTLTK
jgi:hypothetical protein